MTMFKRGAVAFVLSILVPGLGQIFNGQLLAGVAVFIVYVLWLFCAGMTHLLHSLATAIFYLVVMWTFELAIAVYAVRVAIRQVKDSITPERNWRLYAAGALMLCISALGFAFGNVPDRILGVHAFKIPADSMRPTVISGDPLVVDMTYYETHSPNRGEVIVFKEPQNNVLFTKRIIAIGGDIIAGDSEGITLNGRRISEPYVLATHESVPEDNPNFGPLTVPMNSLFVMGDNRENSFDSRYFGPVGVDRLIGKPLYIYYSTGNLNRIGHTIN